MKNKTEMKKYQREWYKKNKDKKLEYKKAYLKKTNYIHEKTIEQKSIRNIKRKTRYYFLLLGHKCEFCGRKATEHHHNTIPIEFDKFNYICRECHRIIHSVKKEGEHE